VLAGTCWSELLYQYTPFSLLLLVRFCVVVPDRYQNVLTFCALVHWYHSVPVKRGLCPCLDNPLWNSRIFMLVFGLFCCWHLCCLLCPLICYLALLVVLWYLLSGWIVVLIFYCGLLCPGSVLVHYFANWVVPLHLWLCYSVALCTIANYFVALRALAYYLLPLWTVACSCCLCWVVLLIYGCWVRNNGPSN
jgi:hypothetical protein